MLTILKLAKKNILSSPGGGTKGWVQKIILVFIFFIGIFLRLYKLGTIPNSYTPDELAQGYTAYSLLETGADEWGNRNPFVLRSFGDYKLPLQTWLMIPSIKTFGLTPFAVRLPNAILSCVSLYFFYLLLKKVIDSKNIAFGLLIFALSSWSVPMSRLALEANILVSLFTISLYYLSNQKIIVASIFLALCLSTYHSATVLVPTIILGIIIFNPFKYSTKQLWILIITVLVFALPQKISNLSIPTSRANDIAIFHPTDNWQSVSDTQYQQTQNGLPPFFARSYTNKLTYTFRLLITNLTNYFSPQFLISNGPGETTYGMIPGFGVIGISLSLILVAGLIIYLNSTRTPLINFLLFSSIFLPLAGALAKGSYSANRVSLWLPILLLLITSLANKLPKKTFWLATFIFIIEASNFFATYFFQANNILAQGMLYGHEQANFLISQYKPDKIIYSRKLSEPQAYYLFFQKPAPSSVQDQTNSWLEYQNRRLKFLDQLGEYSLNNVVFKEISLPADISTPNTLIIGRPEEFHDLQPSHIINYPSFTNDHPAIYLYLTPKTINN